MSARPAPQELRLLSRDWEAFAAGPLRGAPRHALLYELGVLLETRLLAAVGVRAGLIQVDEAAAWLDSFFGRWNPDEFYYLLDGLSNDDRLRLPPFESVDALLGRADEGRRVLDNWLDRASGPCCASVATASVQTFTPAS